MAIVDSDKVLRELQKKKKGLDSLDIFESAEEREFVESFITYLKTQATTDRGQPIIVKPWFEEYARLLSNLNKSFIAVSGAAQIGKTLCLILLYCYLFSLGANLAYVFAKQKMVDRQVNTQIKPILGNTLATFEIDNKLLTTNTNKHIHNAKFKNNSYHLGAIVETSNSGGAGQNANIVSFTADATFCDEASQYPPEFVEQLAVRREQSRFRLAPERLGGTPGAGRGIEVFKKSCVYNFEGAVTCQHCHKTTTLSPIGALAIDHGAGWHDKQLKPLNWRYKDANNRVATSYFGCTRCDSELIYEEVDCYFYDFQQGISLKEYNEYHFKSNDRCFITLTPLFRCKHSAKALLEEWLSCFDIENFIQQTLGLPYERSGAGITATALSDAIITPRRKRYGDETVRVFGIDQGTDAHYCSCIDFHYDPGQVTQSIIDNCVADVILLTGLTQLNLHETLEQLRPDFLAIDIDPNRSVASEIVRESGISSVMVDQRSANSSFELYKDVELKEAGVPYRAIALKDSQIKNDLAKLFNDRRVALPEHFKHFLVGKHAINPLKQLASVTWSSSEGAWIRPSDKQDDLFHAAMFTVFGFRYWLEHNNYKRTAQYYETFHGFFN